MSRVDHFPEEPGMSVEVAIYRAARDYRGGITALALEMGVNYNTLAHKLNPQKKSHVLFVDEMLAIIRITRDQRILQALGQRMGFVHYDAARVQSREERLLAISRLHAVSSALTRAIAPFVSETQTPTARDMAEMEHQGYLYLSCVLSIGAGAGLSRDALQRMAA